VNTTSRKSVLGRVRNATQSDEALLERSRRGDSAGFDELYRRYKSAVFGYCLTRLDDRQAAEDAAQEVFIKAHGATGAPVGNVRGWLFTVARNVVIDAARRRRATPGQVELEAAVDAAVSDADEVAFSDLDTSSNVFVALRRLSSRDRKTLILRDFHDKSSQEIAEELSLRPSSVDTLICRARAAFGRAYAEVSEMPFACRQTTEMIYREGGSGITDRQRQLMEAHLAVCPRCAAERARAHSPRFVGALLPWLWLRLDALGLAGSLGSLPPAAKAVLGAAVTVAVLVPGIASQTAPVPVIPFESALTQQSPLHSAPGPSPETTSGGSDHGGTLADGHDATTSHELAHLRTEAHPMAMAEDGHGSTTSGTSHLSSTHVGTQATEHATTPTGVEAHRTAGVTDVQAHTTPGTRTEPVESH